MCEWGLVGWLVGWVRFEGKGRGEKERRSVLVWRILAKIVCGMRWESDQRLC